jgi:uncharacterized OB-fold protein
MESLSDASFKYGSALPKMIRTGRLNSLNFGSIFVRDLMVGNRYATPRARCITCGGRTDWFELPLKGRVHSWTLC